jgi:hypothetical protein
MINRGRLADTRNFLGLAGREGAKSRRIGRFSDNETADFIKRAGSPMYGNTPASGIFYGAICGFSTFDH